MSFLFAIIVFVVGKIGETKSDELITVENFALVAHSYKSVSFVTFERCIESCKSETTCISVNFQGSLPSKGCCSLNGCGRDINTSLVFSPGCLFHQVRPSVYPLTEEWFYRKCSAKVSKGTVVSYRNCRELKEQNKPSGVYAINPDGKGAFLVYCDQTTDGGGWIVFQRRLSPFALSFNRNWSEYQRGFGEPGSEFWLGNDKIHRLTKSGARQFRVDLTSSVGSSGFAKFADFQVASSSSFYRWNMTSYSGNIGNAIFGSSKPLWRQTGMPFSTPDQDNDGWPDGRCKTKSGFWANWCGKSDLNRFSKPKWATWIDNKDAVFNISESSMKVR